eukprot:6249755-Alexandrium_andersonii.AAC.1
MVGALRGGRPPGRTPSGEGALRGGGPAGRAPSEEDNLLGGRLLGLTDRSLNSGHQPPYLSRAPRRV